MLLQTLVQLNILILATPALAGWMLLPTTHPGIVRAASIVLQTRAVEAVAPKATAETVQTRQSARSLPTALPHLALSSANPVPIFYAAAPSAAVSRNPFPHAVRAP